MNLGGKHTLDAWLKGWPASSRDEEESSWEARADAMVRAAVAAKRQGSSPGGDEAFLAAPALVPEPGEDAGVSTIQAAGGHKMSHEKDPADPPTSSHAAPSLEPEAAVSRPTASVPPERKRQSLKEIAARASQSGARLSSPGLSTPPPSQSRSLVSMAASMPLARPSMAPLSRPSEAGQHDSGVINLQRVSASVTAKEIAAADKAKPAQAGLFEDEQATQAAKHAGRPPAVEAPSNVVPLQPKKSSKGAVAGVVIAVLGVAAAVAMVQRAPSPSPLAQVRAEAPKARSEEPKAAAPVHAAPVATAEPTALAAAEAAPHASSDAKSFEGTKSGASSGGVAAAPAEGWTAAKASPPAGKPGDLQSEMAKAVKQDSAAKGAEQPVLAPEPAAAAKSQNIPEQPSQGAVAASVGAVMAGAKACVAGADDVSRATLTFASAGTVSNVSVTGWAAANGKSSCVQAALKGAKVGPFSKPSFTFGMTIRP